VSSFIYIYIYLFIYSVIIHTMVLLTKSKHNMGQYSKIDILTVD
jgi:hypothetical protein